MLSRGSVLVVALFAAAPLGGALATDEVDPGDRIDPGNEAVPDDAVDEPPVPEPVEEKWKPKKPKLYGYVQVHFRYAFETGVDGVVDNPDFRVQRVRLGAKGLILPKIGYEVEFDPRAPEVRGILRDAFIHLDHVPFHEIRLGQQKTQFGYENPTSSTRLYAVNRTEVSDNLSRGSTLRDVGIGVLGKVPASKRLWFEDAVTLTNGTALNPQEDDTPMKNVWGRVGLLYGDEHAAPAFFRVGVSGAVGDFVDPGDDVVDPADDFVQAFQRFGGDAQVTLPWLFAVAEYVGSFDQIEGEAGYTSGWYVNLVGRTPWNAGPIARFDAMADDYQRFTFGAYYGEADDRFRVLLNYEYRRLMDGVRGDDKLYVWTQVRF